jgi:hypothetical protein
MRRKPPERRPARRQRSVRHPRRRIRHRSARGAARMRPLAARSGRRCEPDRTIVLQLPRHTDNFRGNTVASRGVRLGAAPDAPLRGRCSSATHCPAGRVVAPRGWPSVRKPEHWTVPATIRARMRRRGWSKAGGSDRANLPDHLVVPGFFCGSRGWGARTCGGRSRSPSRERGAPTSRLPKNAAGPAGRTAPPGLPVARVTGTRSPGKDAL